MMDRVEYVLRLTHDHCDDGDELRRRQTQESMAHAKRSHELLTIARGVVSLLEKECQMYERFLPKEEQPIPRIMRAPPQKAAESG